ncbi:hypothetical protein [Halorubrum sp. GN11GM_10-3_MGM]|uniref:hypothetical protein n=1 Tax=Halorubrum sp. GN11GM_10-3_MGM TaxID=2518111 RepID=UPI0010F94D85|nr:hypothetical protein [Halorubrum sp. GN11GM_10-3_MGM]TKX72185.1 hypothetical protein EXE40_04905 [Halorubrum sp. GN11GM_10-3_MGM]
MSTEAPVPDSSTESKIPREKRLQVGRRNLMKTGAVALGVTGAGTASLSVATGRAEAIAPAVAGYYAITALVGVATYTAARLWGDDGDRELDDKLAKKIHTDAYHDLVRTHKDQERLFLQSLNNTLNDGDVQAGGMASIAASEMRLATFQGLKNGKTTEETIADAREAVNTPVSNTLTTLYNRWGAAADDIHEVRYNAWRSAAQNDGVSEQDIYDTDSTTNYNAAMHQSRDSSWPHYLDAAETKNNPSDPTSAADWGEVKSHVPWSATKTTIEQPLPGTNVDGDNSVEVPVLYLGTFSGWSNDDVPVYCWPGYDRHPVAYNYDATEDYQAFLDEVGSLGILEAHKAAGNSPFQSGAMDGIMISDQSWTWDTEDWSEDVGIVTDPDSDGTTNISLIGEWHRVVTSIYDYLDDMTENQIPEYVNAIYDRYEPSEVEMSDILTGQDIVREYAEGTTERWASELLALGYAAPAVNMSTSVTATANWTDGSDTREERTGVLFGNLQDSELSKNLGEYSVTTWPSANSDSTAKIEITDASLLAADFDADDDSSFYRFKAGDHTHDILLSDLEPVEDTEYTYRYDWTVPDAEVFDDSADVAVEVEFDGLNRVVRISAGDTLSQGDGGILNGAYLMAQPTDYDPDTDGDLDDSEVESLSLADDGDVEIGAVHPPDDGSRDYIEFRTYFESTADPTRTDEEIDNATDADNDTNDGVEVISDPPPTDPGGAGFFGGSTPWGWIGASLLGVGGIAAAIQQMDTT